jgi:glycosyltransferase involved in cell wall biosynthesis
MISILAYIALFFLGLRLLVVIVNVLFHCSHRKYRISEAEKISVLIPARNEENNIARLLDGLLSLPYKNMEVLVCDDHSTDRTPAILEEYAKDHPATGWFRGKELAPGWTGKNYACHQLAGKATGEVLLFVDADMELSGDIVARMAGYMKKQRLALLSVFPMQQLISLGEKATVPVMNWILLSLLPLPMVTFSPRSSFSAANGQFMMFRANTYHKLQPHSILRASAVEDIGIMRLYKKERYRCATLLGDSRVRCRMYAGYREAISGFSKNVLHFFSGSLAWAFFYIFFTTFGLLFIGLWSVPMLFVSLFAALFCRVLISLISHQNILNNLLLVPVQHISFLQMVFLALSQRSKGSLEWKGREVKLK